MASHRHAPCMHACKYMYIHPPHIKIIPIPKSIHSKVHKFMVMAETSTFGILHDRNVRGRNVLAEMSVAETSVAEISYIRSNKPVTGRWYTDGKVKFKHCSIVAFDHTSNKKHKLLKISTSTQMFWLVYLFLFLNGIGAFGKDREY